MLNITNFRDYYGNSPIKIRYTYNSSSINLNPGQKFESKERKYMAIYASQNYSGDVLLYGKDYSNQIIGKIYILDNREICIRLYLDHPDNKSSTDYCLTPTKISP